MKKLIFTFLFCLFSNYTFAQYIPFAGVSSTTGVACAQMPAFTGDVTSPAGSCVNTNVNLPTGVTIAGSLLASEIAAPATPATGKVLLWVDSTNARLHDINPAGIIGTTVVANAGSSNNFVTGISTAGLISVAQPSAANLSNGVTGTGAVVLANSPTFTGIPLAPSAGFGTNSTQIATTAFVDIQISFTCTATGGFLVGGPGGAGPGICTNTLNATSLVNGHILATGAAPTISSCGTGSPSITGGDNFGTVIAGGGVLTSCVITFGLTWGATPHCVISSTTAIASATVTTSTTQLTIGGTSLTGDVINWVCGSTS